MRSSWRDEVALSLEGGPLPQERVRDVYTAARALPADPLLSGEYAAWARGASETVREALLRGRFAIPARSKETPLAELDWRAPPAELDRSDLWLLQQWHFLREATIGLDADPADTRGLDVAEAAVRAWIAANLTPEAAEDGTTLAWHDHATALRAVQALRYLTMLAVAGRPLEAGFPRLPEFVAAHVAALSAESFYSRGTNHGFDQAYALFLIASLFDLGELTRVGRETGRRRLLEEMAVAFNREGVHIENSPGYHPIMMGRMVRAAALLRRFGADDVLLDLEDTLARALAFLAAALRPDGSLPQLGDTESRPLGPRFRELAGEQPAYGWFEHAVSQGKGGAAPPWLDRVFPDAGYAFFRDRWPEADAWDQAVHLSFKCGFLSSYHRHDDDNSLLMYAFGEDWLIDGGVYKYHERDPYRMYLRSSRAHNTVTVVGAVPPREPARGRIGGFTAWSKDARRAELTSSSPMFPGFVHERTVTFDRQALSVELRDRVEPEGERRAAYELCFHVPADKDVAVATDGRVSVTSRRSGRILWFEPIEGEFAPVRVVTGQPEPEPIGWTSPTIGRLERAVALIWRADDQPRFHSRLRLRFGEASA